MIAVVLFFAAMLAALGRRGAGVPARPLADSVLRALTLRVGVSVAVFRAADARLVGGLDSAARSRRLTAAACTSRRPAAYTQ